MTTFKANQLIASLPEEAYCQWAPQLKEVDMRLGDVLHEPGGTIEQVYFPTTSLVSLLYTLENGASTEVAVVGNEGIVGVSAFMGGNSTPNQSVVRSSGRGYRLPAGVVIKALENARAVTHLMLLYTQALMTQMAQTAVCTRHHSLTQRLCRFLLFSMDRLDSHELWMTQDLICNMLGVRREGVTEAALSLQKAGLIRYQRGHISVVDRAALERRSCECYAVITREYDRLLPRKAAETRGLTRPRRPAVCSESQPNEDIVFSRCASLRTLDDA